MELTDKEREGLKLFSEQRIGPNNKGAAKELADGVRSYVSDDIDDVTIAKVLLAAGYTMIDANECLQRDKGETNPALVVTSIILIHAAVEAATLELGGGEAT